MQPGPGPQPAKRPSAFAYHCMLDFREMPFQLLAFCSPPSFFGAALNQVPTDGRLANLNHGMSWNIMEYRGMPLNAMECYAARRPGSLPSFLGHRGTTSVAASEAACGVQVQSS